MNAAAIDSSASGNDSRAMLPTRDMPFVSVIIPVRNDAQRLARCLDSLAKQNYPADRFEVIVVDNGSTDESAAVAEARGATVLCHPGLRVGALRNRGVAIARGSILAFVDSDHETPADWLGVGVSELVNSNDVLMIGSPCLADPKGTWVQKAWELHRTRGECRRDVNWLGAGNMFLRTQDFMQIGGFDEHLVAAEDVDLCVRLAKLPGNIVSDMRAANIHHGEPRTLFDFAKKEYWRGSSGLIAFFSHGLPLHELPSLLFPLYHLFGLVGLVLMTGLTIAGLPWPFVATALFVLVLPSIVLGLKTCWQVQNWPAFSALATLYFVYGLTRALALFKR